MDPFQLRLSFLSTLKRLSASQSSIYASLSFLTSNLSSSSDLWSCLIDTCTSSSLNTRINLLFLISSLFTDDVHSNPAVRATYTPLLHRDADTLVDLMVPPARWEAVLNVDATSKVLATWKTKMVLEPARCDQLAQRVEQRRKELYLLPPEERVKGQGWSEQEVVRRVEEDRERHKRLRENLWILPPTSTVQSVLFGVEPHHLNPLFLPPHLRADDTAATATDEEGGVEPSSATIQGTKVVTAHDLDFNQAWETTSDWNSDDEEAIVEQNAQMPLGVDVAWLSR